MCLGFWCGSTGIAFTERECDLGISATGLHAMQSLPASTLPPAHPCTGAMGRSRSRSRGYGGGGGERDRIQSMVDERQQCRRDRNFDKADELRDQLRGMGVNIDDTDLTWRGPGGFEGQVANGGSFGGGGGGGGGSGAGIQRRDGDWDCPQCGKMVFASKDECFSCGAPKPRGGGGRGYDGGGRSPPRKSRYDDSPPRRSSRYDDSPPRGRRYDDRDDRGGRRGRDYDESPPRRNGRY